MLRGLIAVGAIVSLVVFLYPFPKPEQNLLTTQEAEVGSPQESFKKEEAFPLHKNAPQPNAPELFGDFNIIDTETIEIDFNADTLLVEQALFYLDPISGDLLGSTLVRTVSNAVSQTLLSSVEINGTRRPLTITIADETVFMTLPYTGGVLTGEGSRSSITLRKQKPMRDFVKDEVVQPEILNEEPLQEMPVCLNC